MLCQTNEDWRHYEVIGKLVELKDGRYYFLRSCCEIVMSENHDKITFVNVVNLPALV